ncbi:MAG: single-stranded DNA-binding protein [Plectolyngbya sp. WJT66-NPBG17]|jgi:single-strand DNA-binding protein|nr:single-stranded DNA-binding protein [Plectolyngbya sp. WJT66-NPBG17]MBW4528394.1 single-stranded DNA-binding protein [Phormidium tanganyikae FI6-MK23]
MNTTSIIGYVGAKPELKQMKSGAKVAKLSLYYNRRYKVNGEVQEEKHRFSIEAWGATADFMMNYLDKGSRIAVTGELRTSSWTVDNGNGESETRTRVYILAKNISNLTAKNGADAQSEIDEDPGF